MKDIVVYESSTYSLNEFIDSDNTGVYPIFDANRIIKEINKYDQGEEYISIIKDGSGVGRIDKKPSYSSVIGTMGYLIPNNKEIDFLYCIIKNIDFRKYIIGSTIPHIYFKDYGEVKITIPIIPEQSKVGRFIDLIDKVITLHQRKLLPEKTYNNNLNPQKHLRDFRIFGDNQGIRAYAWEQYKLGEVIDVRSGKDYKHLSKGDIPVYGTGGYMLSVSEALSYKEDGIGIGRKGTIDKPYILKAPFWTVDTLFYAIPRENYDLFFIFNLFQNINWKIKDESTGVPSLSKIAIRKINVTIPNEYEQKLVGEYLTSIDQLITLHQRKQLPRMEKINAK